ncbi:deoxyribonuclease [Halobacteriales archaeon QH_10_67_22]|nr:MAG: deoxyribonuclease [Halobacteriales archaeon QH_10_67_22]
MELPDRLQCLFSATVEEDGDSYVVTVPERELRRGEIQNGKTYRVAILSAPSGDSEPTETDTSEEREHDTQEPPVEVGESRTVEIEGLGDQGDGIARVERGFVVIVPDTEKGERVRVEISDVSETVAFATVVERLSYYD